MAIPKRRRKKNRKEITRDLLWPSMGWARTLNYYYHRVFRTGDSTSRIAGGLAMGAAVSWTPFFGLHILGAVFLCWLFRFSALAGMVGTVFGNPWTYPFILWVAYKTGVWLCGLFGLAGFISLPGGVEFAHFIREPLTFLKYLSAHPQKLLLPLTVGGSLCGLLCWPVAYAVLYYPVRAARSAYRLQRLRRYKKHMTEEGP